MNLHEYQAKNLLKKYGIPIPAFAVASNLEEVKQAIRDLHLFEAVVKIQVHAGGRGKAGGVKFAKGADEILKTAGTLIGMKMVNGQTGKEGVISSKVLISGPLDINKEFYLGAVIDRDLGRPVLIASPDGGVEIEEVAASHPERVLKMAFERNGHLRAYQLIGLSKFMGWTGEVAKQGALLAQEVARAFIENDAALLEINPLIETPKGELFALDAKVSIDDNALFRHPKLASEFDTSQISSQEAAAKQHDLSYIAMEGNIGCMVNGAGLAMATMDIIRYYGGNPANFLDVGGSATKEKVKAGFQIILSDPKVKAILVNIFGGIMSCRTIAEGVVEAVKELELRLPLVVRMEGSEVAEGKKWLGQSGLQIDSAKNLADAAKRVVERAHGHSGS
jgi:succinyl-CoA synthetase beta subunit